MPQQTAQLPVELWQKVAVCLASDLTSTEWPRAAAVLSSVSTCLREAVVGPPSAALWQELSFVSSPFADEASSACMNRYDAMLEASLKLHSKRQAWQLQRPNSCLPWIATSGLLQERIIPAATLRQSTRAAGGWPLERLWHARQRWTEEAGP